LKLFEQLERSKKIWPAICNFDLMRKAVFLPFEKKKDDQVAFEASLTGQQRIDRMFKLIDAAMHLQKKYSFTPPKNSIALKRKR
jgi:hypothetical protein